MKTLLCTVVHRKSERYLPAFFSSIANQTIKNFDFLIINDGISDISRFLCMLGNLRSILIENKFIPTPAYARHIAAIYAVRNKYKYFVFADSDDLCMEDRVEKVVHQLEKNDLVYNDMNLINSEGISFGERYYDLLPAGRDVTFDKLTDQNYIGLSNAGMRVNFLMHALPVPIDVIAVDWWFASNIALNTKKIRFIEEPLTLYRQHCDNIAGVKNTIDKRTLDQAVKVKKLHYFCMCEKYIYNPDVKRIHKQKLIEMIKLDAYLNKSSNYERVLGILNGYSCIYPWWGCALSLERLEEMENANNKIGFISG